MNDKINNKPYTSEEKEIIFEMHSQGFNCKEIGDKLGKSDKAINKFLHRNNLNTNQSILNKLADDEIKDMSWTTFVYNIVEPELIEYLKERRIYINEPIDSEEEV